MSQTIKASKSEKIIFVFIILLATFSFGSFILIKYAKEPLLELASENLMKIVWHIGNRHIPCQIELDRLLIQEDKVIEELIIKLGGKIKKIHEEFCPEGGAYGLGRTHGHKH